MGTKPTPQRSETCPPTHPQTIRSPRKTLIDERRKQTMLARVGKKSCAGGENRIFGHVATHAGTMDLEPKWIHYRSSQVIYRRSTHPPTHPPSFGPSSLNNKLNRIAFCGKTRQTTQHNTWQHNTSQHYRAQHNTTRHTREHTTSYCSTKSHNTTHHITPRAL